MRWANITLIIGLKLPKGILLVSDTRETIEETGTIVSEVKRKITLITPTILLGGSGSESNWHTSKILRHCLYSNSSNLSTGKIRNEILNLYRNVNYLHRENHKYGHPIGNILVAEYDKDKKEFNLLGLDSYEFESFDILNKIKDVRVIGSNGGIRSNVKTEVEDILNSFTYDELSDKKVYERIAKRCQMIIMNQSDKGIGEHVYCTYLSVLNEVPASALFFIKSNGELINIDAKDDGEEISVHIE